MSMWISIISMTTFLTMGVYMVVTAHFSSTRRVASVPLLMTAAEAAMFGMLYSVSNPAALLLLVSVRVCILMVCCFAIRADRAAAKARRRRRQRFHIEWKNATEPLYVMRRERAAAQIDIVA